MGKTNSNDKRHENSQVSDQVYIGLIKASGGLPITAQNIKPPEVKPPKPPQQESQSQPPQNRN